MTRLAVQRQGIRAGARAAGRVTGDAGPAVNRRRYERERKAEARAEARANGVPSAEQVKAAVTEALSFVANAGAGGRVNIGPSGQVLIDAGRVIRVAVKILVKRGEFDEGHSKAAVLKALGPREEHQWPSHYPTHHVGEVVSLPSR